MFKIYNTEDEVKECELKHSEDKRIKTEKLAIQKSRWKEVCESEENIKIYMLIISGIIQLGTIIQVLVLGHLIP